MIQTPKGLCLTEAEHETFVAMACSCGGEMFALRPGLDDEKPDDIWCRHCWMMAHGTPTSLFGEL